MNIVFHLLTNDPEHDAVAKRTIGTAKIMSELGHNVYVISNIPDYINGEKRKGWLFKFYESEFKDGIHYKRYFCVPFFYKNTIRRLLNYYSFRFSSSFAHIKDVKIDAIIATEPPLICSKAAVKLAKRFKCKLYFDIQDIWPDVAIEMNAFTKDSFKAKSFYKIANYMYKNADYVLTVSNYKVNHLNQLLEKYNKKAVFIPNATDDYFIHQNQDKEFLNKYKFNQYFSCVHVGKVGKAQDLDSFVDLAKKYISNDNIKFYLLGDGVEMNRILSRINDENVTNIVYCGVCNSQQCYTALANAKVSYVSLVNKNLKDSVPTKLFESLYSGCPCLVSANGESAEIIDNLKFGMSCEAGDFDKLCSNFEYILNNYSNVMSYKESCFKYIKENYERLNVTRKLTDLIKENI